MSDSAFTLSSSIAPIFSVIGINAKVVANTLGYTNNLSQTLVITGGVVRCTSATSITDGPTLGIGNSSGTSNIFTATTLHVLVGVSNVFSFTTYGMSLSIPPGGNLYVNISNASTGTAQTLSVDINGYFI